MMAARIVDDLELVEVDVQDRIRCLAGFSALQRALETVLELPAIDELREHVVGSRVTQAPIELT